MQNAVPTSAGTDGDAPVAERVASRTLAGRTEAYADEVRRLVDAGYAVLRRTGNLDPRVTDIVSEAGLSNQAFYRHFRGKDELLVAILEDGQRQLLTYLEHRMARAEPGAHRVRAWVGGVMEQARNSAAAENTRPFAMNNARLASRFPDEVARSRELLVAPLRDAVADAGGDSERDANVIYHLTIGCMNDALVARRRPTKSDVQHLEQFVLGGLRGT